jgi:oxygen-dependent protoporphyrinogen oxidase
MMQSRAKYRYLPNPTSLPWLNGIQLKTLRNHPPVKYDNCVSALPASTLATLTPHLPALRDIHSVTVMVVNLFYTDPNVLPVQGFGYLIPRSIPLSQNPECALGVVFDSMVEVTSKPVTGTKVTVMLGGHYWDSFSHYPDEAQGLVMAQSVLKRHLNIDVKPSMTFVGLKQNCIPQYYVGHDKKLTTTDIDLRTRFRGKLSVVGSSYTGVGVNDCIRASMEVAAGLADSPEDGYTGLEFFRVPRPW